MTPTLRFLSSLSQQAFGENHSLQLKLVVALLSAVLSVNSTAVSVKVYPSHFVALSSVEQIRFQCYYKGKPSVENPTYWTRNGKVLDCNQRQRLIGCRDTLIISKFRSSDSGRYYCHVNDAEISSVGETEIRVPVQFETSDVTTITVSLLHQNSSVSVTLTCPVTEWSYPKPSVLWRKEGKLLSTGDTIQYIVTDVSQLGQLDCLAYNGYGGIKVKQFNLVAGNYTQSLEEIRSTNTILESTSHADTPTVVLSFAKSNVCIECLYVAVAIVTSIMIK